ncbi:MAG: hypothetical protein MUO29_10040 [Desulfobacterales bacterium]|nr:hypothetical protein [Desulfobacterales bacterium]
MLVQQFDRLLCKYFVAGQRRRFQDFGDMMLRGDKGLGYVRLDWFTPLTGGGGGPASSANYAVNLTVGQAVIGASSSANYGGGVGYWYGAAAQYRIYLPLLLRNDL